MVAEIADRMLPFPALTTKVLEAILKKASSQIKMFTKKRVDFYWLYEEDSIIFMYRHSRSETKNFLKGKNVSASCKLFEI